MQATLLPRRIPFPQGAAPRTPGVHLSGLLKSMAVDYGFLDKQWADDLKLVEVEGSGEAWWNALDDASQIRMSLGLAWEQWYLPQVPGVLHQPGELQVEGIYMSRDGESLDVVMAERKQKHIIALHECKVTSKSINTVGDLNASFFNPKNWLWTTQIACYCYAMSTTVAYLHILYLYGDYTRPYRQVLHVWRLEFTETELVTIWRRVRDYRDECAAKGVLG